MPWCRPLSRRFRCLPVQFRRAAFPRASRQPLAPRLRGLPLAGHAQSAARHSRDHVGRRRDRYRGRSSGRAAVRPARPARHYAAPHPLHRVPVEPRSVSVRATQAEARSAGCPLAVEPRAKDARSVARDPHRWSPRPVSIRGSPRDSAVPAPLCAARRAAGSARVPRLAAAAAPEARPTAAWSLRSTAAAIPAACGRCLRTGIAQNRFRPRGAPIARAEAWLDPAAMPRAGRPRRRLVDDPQHARAAFAPVSARRFAGRRGTVRARLPVRPGHAERSGAPAPAAALRCHAHSGPSRAHVPRAPSAAQRLRQADSR